MSARRLTVLSLLALAALGLTFYTAGRRRQVLTDLAHTPDGSVDLDAELADLIRAG